MVKRLLILLVEAGQLLKQSLQGQQFAALATMQCGK